MIDAETLAYNKRQYEQVYGSTVEFADFIAPLMHDAKNIVDIGCGAGAPTKYLADRFPQTELFVGIEKEQELLEIASEKTNPKTFFMKGDVFDLPSSLKPDGVISLQMFSWLSEIEAPLIQICTKLKPEWIAFSSLFFEGDISCDIKVHEPKVPRESFYNIYSIPAVSELLGKYGYYQFRIQKFGKGPNLQPMPKPFSLQAMRSYTVDTVEGGRMIMSGPLMLPWYFLSYRKVI